MEVGWVRLVPIPTTIRAARRFVRKHHRHLKDIQGGLFAVAVAVEGQDDPCGVAIVGRPSRTAQDGWTCCVTRVATDGTPNACSKLYAMCRNIVRIMGYKRCKTFTLLDEPGTSLFALGIEEPEAVTKGGEWGRDNRPRETVNDEPKNRWELL